MFSFLVPRSWIIIVEESCSFSQNRKMEWIVRLIVGCLRSFVVTRWAHAKFKFFPTERTSLRYHTILVALHVSYQVLVELVGRVNLNGTHNHQDFPPLLLTFIITFHDRLSRRSKNVPPNHREECVLPQRGTNLFPTTMTGQSVENYGGRGAADLDTILSSFQPSPNEDYTYSMPAEWEEHSACLILFPHNPETFRVSKAAQEIANLALEIATSGQESVFLLCKDPQIAEDASKAVLSRWSEHQQHKTEDQYFNQFYHGLPICTAICPSNDTWARDTGPTFVFRRQKVSKTVSQQEEKVLVGLDWDFNAYGGPEEGCYWPCADDRKIADLVCSPTTLFQTVISSKQTTLPNINLKTATSIAESLSIHSSLPIPMILEGGSFHTDGEGTLLTTSECLLNPNRNPHLSKDQIESALKESLGIHKVLWLPYGLDNDLDTNGHVDNFCCFAKPGHVILAWTDHQDDQSEMSNYQRCRVAQEYLEAATDAQGRKLEITKLYLPKLTLQYTKEEAMSIGTNENDTNTENQDSMAFVREPGEKMAASYINFYIANRAILVPQFASSTNDDLDLAAADQSALETLQSLFPGRRVVGIPSREILLGGGNIHCQTQQVPSI